MSLHDRLPQLGLVLPPPPEPQGLYRSAVIRNGIVHVAGQLSRDGASVIEGPVGDDTDPATIARAAQACVLRALSAIAAIVDLDRIDQVIFVRGFVHAVPGFRDHSRVVDEASRLILALFGEAGAHARSAVGVASLPASGMLELELMVGLKEA